jgi:hypothetical protein
MLVKDNLRVVIIFSQEFDGYPMITVLFFCALCPLGPVSLVALVLVQRF